MENIFEPNIESFRKEEDQESHIKTLSSSNSLADLVVIGTDFYTEDPFEPQHKEDVQSTQSYKILPFSKDEVNKIPLHNRIVCFSDNSETSFRSFDFVVDHVCVNGDSIFLVHVVTAKSLLQATNEKREAALTDISKKIKHAYSKRLSLQNTTKTIHLLPFVRLSSDHKTEMIKIINELNPKLVVIGKRGLSVIKGLMLGSTSDYIVHHTSFPILVVPPIDII